MRLHALIALAAILPGACRSATETSPVQGYPGIERVELFAKGME